MQEWQNKEWTKYDISSVNSSNVTAYLTPEERQLFCWLAAEKYKGFGEIIDAGSFLGGSAKCFAQGITHNKSLSLKSGRVHSFDLFRFAPWINKSVTELHNHENGDSFLNIYHNNVGKDLEESITIYPGDILKRKWNAGKIEILMLDCLKTHNLSDHCLRIFLPHIKEGSIIIQQDYGVVSRLYWIHLTMYLLRDYFEYRCLVERGGSAVFITKKVPSVEKIEETIKIIRGSNWFDLAMEASDFMSRYDKKASDAVKLSAEGFRKSPI